MCWLWLQVQFIYFDSLETIICDWLRDLLLQSFCLVTCKNVTSNHLGNKMIITMYDISDIMICTLLALFGSYI